MVVMHEPDISLVC